MFVLTLDQRDSRRSPDLVPEFLATIGDIPAVLPFERSVGDEVQGLFCDASAVVDVVMRALRSGRWYVGLGVGTVNEPLPASPREASGPAFIAARQAVDAAKKAGERVPLALRGDRATNGRSAAAAEAVLWLVGDLVRSRTVAEWRVLDLLPPGRRGLQVAVASSLGITPQAVSKAIRRARLQEERAGRAAAVLLLEQLTEPPGLSVPVRTVDPDPDPTSKGEP
jgi:hypothetical protein